MSATVAGISAGFSQGVGDYFGGLGDFAGKELAQAGAHGLTQGGVSLATGGNFWQGFGSGAVGSLSGSWTGGMDSYGARLAVSAVAGGTASTITGGSFADGAVTAAYVTMFNHFAGEISEYALIKRIQREGWTPLDMSDPYKSYKNTIQGIKVMHAYTRGKLYDIFGDVLQMNEIFDFSTMTAKSGWEVHDGGGLFRIYKNTQKRGVKITLQNGLERVNDIDLRIRNQIRIYSGPDNRWTGEVWYHNSNYADWEAARNFIWNH